MLRLQPRWAARAGGTRDYSLRLWNVASGKIVHVLQGHTSSVNCCAFSSDGRYILSGGWRMARSGLVDIAASQEPDGREVANNVRYGVFVTFKAHSEYARACFKQYGLLTDPSGYGTRPCGGLFISSASKPRSACSLRFCATRRPGPPRSSVAMPSQPRRRICSPSTARWRGRLRRSGPRRYRLRAALHWARRVPARSGHTTDCLRPR